MTNGVQLNNAAHRSCILKPPGASVFAPKKNYMAHMVNMDH